jgi:hypothetical protein
MYESLRSVFLCKSENFDRRVRVDSIKQILFVGICVNCTHYYNKG